LLDSRDASKVACRRRGTLKEPRLSLFLSGCPLWVGSILLVILPTLAAMSGPILIRRRIGLERLTTNNDIAGFKFATVGVIYAVMLGFAIIIVWQRFSDAENMVVKEAGAAATLYRLAAGTDAAGSATRAALTNYLQLAIALDWPQMARVQESHEVTVALDQLYARTLALAASGSRQQAELEEIFHQLDDITQARRSRLHLATGIVPGMLWGVLICGAILTVAFTFFFGTRNLRAQVLMTGVLAVIVFMGLFVIVSIDHPFTGPVHIDSAPLQRALQDFGQD
jgi:hypothetical protein